MQNIPFSDKKQFALFAIKKHLGLIGIWFAFLLFGSFFSFIGASVEENGTGFIIFGILFIVISSAFVIFTLPSSLMYYYDQEKTKKYGSYTFAKITNKRIDDYSHNSASFDGNKSKRIKSFLYVIEFQFNYNNQLYNNECFFEHQSAFEAITPDTELPIKFLKSNPENVTLRRRKLARALGIPEKMCQ